MPTDTERRLEALENLLLFGGGVAAGSLGPRAVIRGGARLASAHPYVLAAALAYEGYIHRDEIADVARTLEEKGSTPAPVGRAVQEQMDLGQLIGLRPGAAGKKIKRKVNKANKAVKEGMKILKSGSKALTGAAPGTLPAGSFRTSVKAAGLANPRTASKIGKGKSVINKLARRLKKWW